MSDPSKALGPRASRNLLIRLLDTPNLEQVVPSLEPETLHQLIRVCGLEDCGEIVTLATPAQLMRVFDHDLWQSDKPGVEDRFDLDRFCLWLEVLVEAGAETAAKMIVEMDFDLVTAALSQCFRVDVPRVAIVDADNDPGSGRGRRDKGNKPGSALEAGVSYEISGYTLTARQTESWDALLALLICLDADHPDYFQRLMHRCARISNEHIDDNGSLYDVLSTADQVVSDMAFEREHRREAKGYVTPSQALAFLESCRQLEIGQAAAPAWDHSTTAYFRDMARRAKNADESASDRADAKREPQGQPQETERHVAGFLAALREAGVIQQPRPQRLLEGSTQSGAPLARIKKHLQFAQKHDARIYSRRLEELGYLANILMAGCTFDSRRFTASEASKATFAACNLGLENWPAHWGSAAEDFLLAQDLVTVFRVGWTALYERVCAYTAERLVEILSELTCDDRAIRDQINELGRLLRRDVRAGTPWRVRDNLDVLAILDLPSWAILLRLLDQCPLVPKGAGQAAHQGPLLRVTSEFDFISENSQIAWARSYIDTLPQRLVD